MNTVRKVEANWPEHVEKPEEGVGAFELLKHLRSEFEGQAASELELTILMPCLNEAETLATCIRKARDYLDRAGIKGEVLIADARRAVRAAHLVPFPLPGGDAAVEFPHRTALALLHTCGLPWAAELAPVRVATNELDLLRRQFGRGFAVTPTLQVAVAGGYLDYSNDANPLNDFKNYDAQGQIVWSPVEGLIMGPAIEYRYVDADDSVYEDGSIWTGLFRVQRTF